MNFRYEAMTTSGQQIVDDIEAAHSEEAIAKIRALKLFPTKVREKAKKKNVERRGIDIGYIPTTDDADDTKLGAELLDEILAPNRPRLIDHEEVERRFTEALDDRKKTKSDKKVPWIILPKYGQSILWLILLVGIVIGIAIGKLI